MVDGGFWVVDGGWCIVGGIGEWSTVYGGWWWWCMVYGGRWMVGGGWWTRYGKLRDGGMEDDG